MPSLLSNEELLAVLVGFDSTSRKSNLPLADFICEYLTRPGIRVERVPSPDSDKVNLVVRVGSGGLGDRTGLALAGHMDVVPAEEPDWRSDPFTLTQVGDSYFGRGACDMKGFLALAINAVAAADPSSYRHPLVLVLTYDEEVGTAGARHLAGTWTGAASLPKATIVGEPTSLRVIRMHKGYLDFHVVIEGLSAHSGYPHLGRSAIEPMGRLIVALTALRETLEGETPPHSEYFPEVAGPLHARLLHAAAARDAQRSDSRQGAPSSRSRGRRCSIQLRSER
jgi:acetylornithine deacetylase